MKLKFFIQAADKLKRNYGIDYAVVKLPCGRTDIVQVKDLNEVDGEIKYKTNDNKKEDKG